MCVCVCVCVCKCGCVCGWVGVCFFMFLCLYIFILCSIPEFQEGRCVQMLQAWPEDALALVANKFLDDVEMSTEVRSETVVMCKHFHQSVRSLSVK